MAFGDFTVDRNSTKYVLGSGGTIVSYPTDEPAFEFNADGTYKGLLVEPAATNICLQSENISTSWTPTNATITTNDTTAPDGTTTADKLNDNNSGGSASVLVSQGFTGLTGGAKYTASVFLKANGLNWAFMQATNYDGSSDGYRYFDLLNGALGSTSGLDDSQIVAYPNGWYRCSITWTQGAADTSFDLRIYVANSDGNATVDRDGTSSIYVWGAQVETGPIATSYIPTTTASVTRVKDDITQTGAQSLIGQTEGTLYLEVDWRLASDTQYLLTVSNGTSSNRFAIFHSSAGAIRMIAEANGVTLTNTGESSAAYSGIQKFAFAYAEDDFELYRNGSSIATDTTGSLAALATLTDIDLGQRSSAAFQANMHIRAVAIYPKRLSDAEAQALTTL